MVESSFVEMIEITNVVHFSAACESSALIQTSSPAICEIGCSQVTIVSHPATKPQIVSADTHSSFMMCAP